MEMILMNDVTFRPYRPAEDEAAVVALWGATLGDSWPITRQAFHATTAGASAYKSDDHEIAERGGEIVGFAATQRSPMRSLGEIMLLLVHPAHQRQGIGRQLLARAVQRLQAQGVERLQLGGGGSVYFWPGVPHNLTNALAFFAKTGWSFVGESVDMALPLHHYQTPAFVMQRVREAGLTIDHPQPSEVEAVLAFERQHFPFWAYYFEQPLRRGALGEVLVAKAGDGAILGSLLVWREEKWEQLLAGPVGALGSVGVCEAARGKGAGLALVARATEIFQEQGCASGWLGWTGLRDWYGKLGYTVWRSYAMSWRATALDKD
jgi:beta-N-acetylhexosaminidase